MRLKDYVYSGASDFYESTAKEILNNITYDHPREIDMYELCEIYGMSINTDLGLDTSIAANTGRRGVISIKEVNDERIFRQILAEEFAHLYIHHNNQLTAKKETLNKIELQAEKLASNILMPTDWLMNIEVFPYRNEMRILATDIAMDFDVTPEYAFKRLKHLNNNYMFGTEPAGVFKDVLYDAPFSFMLPRIFVVLDKTNKFILD